MDDSTLQPANIRRSKAHADLDRAVDRCYRKEAFLTDRQRVESLFALYEKLAAPLVREEKREKWK